MESKKYKRRPPSQQSNGSNRSSRSKASKGQNKTLKQIINPDSNGKRKTAIVDPENAVNQSVVSSMDMERQVHPLRTAGVSISNLFNWRRILGLSQPQQEEPNLELQKFLDGRPSQFMQMESHSPRRGDDEDELTIDGSTVEYDSHRTRRLNTLKEFDRKYARLIKKIHNKEQDPLR